VRTYIDLIETMTYAGLLFEGRKEFLLKTYGPKIEATWQGQSQPPDITAAVDQQAGETIPEKVINYVIGFDPTPKGIYTQWMVTRYLQNALRMLLQWMPKPPKPTPCWRRPRCCTITRTCES
jgi:hypothetical protein